MAPAPETVKTFSEARQALRRPDYFELQKWSEQQIRAVRAGAHPDLLHFERAVIRRLRAIGIPMFTHAMVRGETEQRRLFKEGLSNARAGESPHQYGCAFDLIHCVFAWKLPKFPGEADAIKSWSLIHEIGMEVSRAIGVEVRHGHDWDGDGDLRDQRLWDPAHWELIGWRDFANQYPFPSI